MKQSVNSCSTDLRFSEGLETWVSKDNIGAQLMETDKNEIVHAFPFPFTFGIDRGEDGEPKYAAEGSTRSEMRGILPSCFL